MPEFIEGNLEIRKEMEELKRVPSLECTLESLVSAKDVKLHEIFSSETIEKAWDVVNPELQMFEIPDGTGGVNPGDRRAIFYLISYFKPRSVLEVGTHIGASVVHTAAALHRVHTLENQECPNLVTVDVSDVNDPVSKPWLQHGTRNSPIEMINTMGCSYFVEFEMNASLAYMGECGQKYDFIFLDGAHAAKTVYQEIPAALALLERDGLILLHDYFPGSNPLWSDGSVIPGPFLATDRLITEGVPLKVLPLGQLPWPTKLESNITSLALLVRNN
jgi:predicted O-methyltransferase YrrM